MKSTFLSLLSLPVLAIVASACSDSSSSSNYYVIPSNSELTSIVGSSINRYVAKPNDLTASADKIKDPSAQAGWFVTKLTFTDKYNNVAGVFPGLTSASYVALNTNEWIDRARSQGMSVDSYVQNYFSGYLTVSPSQRDTFFRGVNAVGGGMYQDSFGNLYDAAGSEDKDLETLQAVNEEVALQASGQALSAQFGLSEEQGFRVARLSQEWNTISKSRQMTSKDLDALTGDMLGMNMSAMRAAAKLAAEGDTRSVENLIKNAANNLDTTPENMKIILAKVISGR